ncbi:MAG: hypothetical protein CVU03_00505 [Bacteroidetes bacterium HGW-Bacteroidetes-2]|jgi:hypothetical protein|nr:MAG: hypothetical protein CVU03_00505 [Bacteroidetes bacterium HGW-Bacteroidetes-2]
MKNILIILFICITLSSYTQRIFDEEITYTDVRLPLNPLGKNLEQYHFTVITPYPENNNSLKDFAQKKYDDEVKNYPDVVKESEIKHQEDLVNYDRNVETARENFKLESEEFKKLSLVERLALSDQKPTLNLPRKPEYRKPTEPRFVEPNLSASIVFDPVVLANSYLNLEGFTNGTDNALTGTVTFYDFENLETVENIKETSVYNIKTKSTQKQKTYSYLTSYKRPTDLILAYNGKLIYNRIFEGTGNYTEMEEPRRPLMQNIEKQTISDNLSAINEYINNLYGYSLIETTINIHHIKNNKGEYDAIERAKQFAVSGFKNYKFGQKNQDLQEAINIWNSEIEKANLNDRKALINEKVLRALLLNVAETSLAINDLRLTDETIAKLNNLKNNNSEKEVIDSLKNILEDKKTREKANS